MTDAEAEGANVTETNTARLNTTDFNTFGRFNVFLRSL